MIRTASILCALVLAISVAGSQVRTVSAGAGAVWGFDLAPTVNRVSGYGSLAGLDVGLTGELMLTVSLGYDYLTVQQDSALEQWGWRFWDARYRGNVQFTLNSGDSSNISARFDPLQSIGIYPLAVGLAYRLQVASDLIIVPRAGVGVAFYTRSLALEESWSRYFATADYTFSYDYLNFANPKSGNPPFTELGLDASYAVSDFLLLSLYIRHMYVLSTPGGMGIENLPFRQSASALVLLTFPY